MKKLIFAGLLTAALSIRGQDGPLPAPITAATPSAQPGKPVPTLVDIGTELADETEKLKEKFDAGDTTKADLADNLQSINALLRQHVKDGNREQLARLYLLDAHIYAEGFKNMTEARAIWAQVARDFPGTVAAQGASLSMARLDAQMSAEPDPSVPTGLEIGQKFPGFNETDFAGNPLSTSAHRGKVTMIDFWATWCPPCRAEMPNVIATYQKYHAEGFDIIGVSLDENRNALANFTQAQEMAWPQFFDGQGWDNKLVKQYGVRSIPMDYLLDRHGVIVGKELRGNDLGLAVKKALTEN